MSSFNRAPLAPPPGSAGGKIRIENRLRCIIIWGWRYGTCYWGANFKIYRGHIPLSPPHCCSIVFCPKNVKYKPIEHAFILMGGGGNNNIGLVCDFLHHPLDKSTGFHPKILNRTSLKFFRTLQKLCKKPRKNIGFYFKVCSISPKRD